MLLGLIADSPSSVPDWVKTKHSENAQPQRRAPLLRNRKDGNPVRRVRPINNGLNLTLSCERSEWEREG